MYLEKKTLYSEKKKLKKELKSYLANFDQIYLLYTRHMFFHLKKVYSDKEKKEMMAFFLRKKGLYDLLHLEILNQIVQEKANFDSFYEIYFSLIDSHFSFLKFASKDLRLKFINKSLL